MSSRPYLTRPCSAILQSTMRPSTKITTNDSSSVWECMTWGSDGNIGNMKCEHNQGIGYKTMMIGNWEPNRQLRFTCGCCEDGEYIETSVGQYQSLNIYNNEDERGQVQSKIRDNENKVNNDNIKQDERALKKGVNINLRRSPQINNFINNNNRGKSLGRQDVQQTKRKQLNSLSKSQEKSLQRLKIQKYIQSQKPFTRGMADGKFRTLYGKQCMQSYGRNNTNQPIGGIIYGNHLKTFNINPHSSSNDPKYYQTHTTALNFAKRTKLDQQKNIKRLERQLAKQLKLNVRNETLIPGKDIVYQQVTPQNMYAVMKLNNQFNKNNRQQIRLAQKQIKKQGLLNQKAIQQQYKVQRAVDRQVQKNVPLRSTIAGSETQFEFKRSSGNQTQRFNRQVIYKMIDNESNVRYGADRHALTCFIDTNFPENDAAYTAQLMNRNPIFPKKVKQQDRHLDQIRKQNYVQSVINNYPVHYLTPNVDYSKVVLKQKDNSRNKSVFQRQKRAQSQSIYPITNQQSSNQQRNNQKFNQNQIIQKNTSRGNVSNQPKNILKNGNQFQQDFINQRTNNHKINYLNQSTKASFANPINQTKTQNIRQINYGDNSNRPRAQSYSEEYSNLACNGYTNCLRANLLEQSSRDPHFATQLLIKASQNSNVIPSKTQRVVNQQYDPKNYYPHANHQMNPKLHTHLKSTKIPYAGVESKILDAINS